MSLVDGSSSLGATGETIVNRMLPGDRKQQQLKAICADYKAHLTTQIEGELKSQRSKVYQDYQKQPPQVFGGPTLQCGLQTQASLILVDPWNVFWMKPHLTEKSQCLIAISDGQFSGGAAIRNHAGKSN